MSRSRNNSAVRGALAFVAVLSTAMVSEDVRADAHGARALQSADAQLDRAVNMLFQAKPDAALRELDQLIARHPNFRLAHLVRADLLLARSQPLSTFGNAANGTVERLHDLRAEAQARFRRREQSAGPDKLPRYFLQLAASQRYAAIVDAASSRVYVYENTTGTPRLVADYYATLGRHGIEKQREGDKKTPIGVYHVTSKIPGSQLPDLYGWGAFPLNYPNEWDRRLGRTGSGIWLHGVPAENYSRAPRASDGCVALANPDMEELSGRVQVGTTPVIIADRAEWVSRQTWRSERDAFMQELEGWRAAWESRDVARYLSYYARDFRADGMDLASWSAYKKRVTAGKAWIKLSLTNVSSFRSPGKQPLVAVTFDQDYRSSALSQQSRKRQYWVLEGQRWKIAYEGEMRDAPVNAPESLQQLRSPARLAAVSARNSTARK